MKLTMPITMTSIFVQKKQDLKELCIRFSDHDTGSYWDEEWGDVSYDDSYAKIEIN